MNEELEKWILQHPNATVADAFKAGWMACTDAWCHGKREKMESIRSLIKEIIS